MKPRLPGDWTPHPDIHPEDFARAVLARVGQRIRERKGADPLAVFRRWKLDEEIARLSKENPEVKWLQERTGKTMFNEVDFFILIHWRQGADLRERSVEEALKVLRQVTAVSKDPLRAGRWYRSRLKRLGLSLSRSE